MLRREANVKRLHLWGPNSATLGRGQTVERVTRSVVAGFWGGGRMNRGSTEDF